MFLSVKWTKRWLPTVFLLLSLFLPWWTMIDLYAINWREETFLLRPFESFTLSFLWADETNFFTSEVGLVAWYRLEFSNIPFLLFVSALILSGGLCGLSNERRTRTLGGLLGLGGVVFYFIWRLVFPSFRLPRNFYFGIGEYTLMISRGSTMGAIWFLSIGFYLALAGSLMLLLPLIRTLVERLRKRL